MIEQGFAVGIGLALSSNLLAALSQVLLKTSAKRVQKTRLQEYVNIRVFLAYSAFFLTTLLGVIALRWIPLSLSAALGASGQIFVPMLSRYVLGESISPKQKAGMVLICLGIVVFSFG